MEEALALTQGDVRESVLIVHKPVTHGVVKVGRWSQAPVRTQSRPGAGRLPGHVRPCHCRVPWRGGLQPREEVQNARALWVCHRTRAGKAATA